MKKKQNRLQSLFERKHFLIAGLPETTGEYNENFQAIKNLKEDIDEELGAIKSAIRWSRFGKYGRLWNGWILGWAAAALQNFSEWLFDAIKRFISSTADNPETLIQLLGIIIAELKKQQEEQRRST